LNYFALSDMAISRIDPTLKFQKKAKAVDIGSKSW